MTNQPSHNRFMPWLGALASGLVLAAVFPPFELKDLAWFALVPLLAAMRAVPPRCAMRYGFATGAVFWLFSISWLTQVTVLGWFVLSLYCALYVMPFVLVASFWMHEWDVESGLKNIALMVVLSLTWAGAEYTRSVLLTGFPWSPLGASQYGSLPVIQLARWGGAYLVSALIVFVNVGVALTIMRTIDSWGRKGFRWHPELLVTLAVTIVAFTSGVRHLRAGQTPTRPFRVAIVQPNIPQEDKWTADTVDMIYERLRRLTGDALLLGHLDLIIWPETALPDDVRDSVESYNVVYEAATNGVPLLVGSMDTEWQDEGKPHYFNSSFLFNTNGAIDEVYDKRHLVMFGEYIPLQRALPFVKVLTPIQDSFTPGTTSTVFRLENPRIAFSSLICFEDTVASLARDSVRNGARLLINQTNDGWFDPSSASRQHMLQCVLRCVENGVPAVRSANTGVSCAIDASGRVHDVLDDGQGNVRIQGCRAATVQVPGENMPLTFYTRRGDLFAQGAAAVGGSMFIAFLVRRRKVATSS